MSNPLQLNTLYPAVGAKKNIRRVGRGIGSGRGKTCARGTKGQKARAGGYHKVGFEGGQMPLQRRLPQFGFISRRRSFTDEVLLSSLERLEVSEITVDELCKARLIGHLVNKVKIIYDRAITKPLHIKGLKATAKARKTIEQMGGTIEV